MDVEEVAEKSPEKVLKFPVNPFTASGYTTLGKLPKKTWVTAGNKLLTIPSILQASTRLGWT